MDGLTDPPNLVLRDLICKHGGDYQYYLVSTVTHIVTVNLPDAKVKLLKYVCSQTAWSARARAVLTGCRGQRLNTRTTVGRSASCTRTGS